ncbi:type VI secretion protein ImpB [Aestuariivita sp.]|jgi:DNA polymerase-4|uniref:Y-family DNA polymerase n=1 Tax=Aestuariivita sp. TaxID=1872407 RepID=UPI00217208B2|nr:type VI secretion protein ImpB [Aestuariivita sp.]MCE8005816.1 type VI secretion protein ImpB [Aestuariivita sp.]
MHDHSRGKANGVERLYLDFDSFFATAEQHFNPALRGRSVGVVPLDSPNTGCIAISKEAKALGLKSNVSIRDARVAIPDMIFVVARHDVYVRLHDRIQHVINSCLPVSYVRSIDELVCALLPSEATQGVHLANRIKRELSRNFSEVLTCSIGMAPTELLAKIGAEMNKPDGFCLITAAELPAKLNHLPLQKLPGISTGIQQRLENCGIRDFEALWRIAPKQARAIWGNVEGERFWNGLHGYHSERPATKKRMFGHSRMLPPDLRNKEKIALCARQLCFSAARRLRRTEFVATKLTLGFRGGGYRSASGSRTDDLRWHQELCVAPSRDDRTFQKALAEGLMNATRQRTFKPRSVSVVLHGLLDPEEMTGDLFDLEASNAGPPKSTCDRRRWEQVSDVLDRLRSEFGPDAISLGPKATVPGGYLGAKIAFGRIPERADFNSAPVPDEATHFCSF